MAKISTFITAVNSNNNLGLYCWGGNGELTTEVNEAWIKDKETSVSNANKVIKKWKANYGKPGVRLMDCSGLIVYGLRTSGAKSKTYDTTAEGLRDMCTELDKKELRDGDLCFRMGWRDDAHTKWGAVHVGMYIGGRVIESRGRDFGVVTRSLGAAGWSKYGRLNIKWEDEPEKYVLTRLLKKGCKGSDVKALQERLLKLGYSLKRFGADGSFGSETRNAVLEMQGNSAIKQDGIVGRDTCKVLGWTWRG